MHSAYSKFWSLNVLVFLFFIFPLFALAQTTSDIMVNVVPPNPSPFESVTINLNSYAFNLESVLITWYENGSVATSGIGKKSFTTSVAGSGSTTTVIVKIALPSGTMERTIALRPAVMTMLWQANDSYVPPFYRGRALPTAESEIKIVAIPEIKNGNGSFVDPKNMTYAWKRDYTNNQEGSGYGKNYFIYTNDFLEDSNTVSATASTIDGQTNTTGDIGVNSFEPEIVFYKSDAELGTLFNQSLTDPHRVVGAETLVAVPFFLSPKEFSLPIVNFNWSINDSPITISGFKKNIVPLKVEEGTSGISKVRLEIENKYKIFQNLSKEINIEF